MNKVIETRRSIRKYTDQKVSEEDIREILAAGMCGPSTCNSRPWQFIVVTDKEVILKMAEAIGPEAKPLTGAVLAILVCGDMNRIVKRAPEYWTIDASIATENMILEAWDRGIGSCWLGTWPQETKMNGMRQLFNLPDNIIPHSTISFGYPDPEELASKKERDLYEEERVHCNKW